jgi:HlyD family secretion protein
VRLAPPDPRRNQLLFSGIGIAIIASILFAAPWVKRWANATVSVPYDRVRTAIVSEGDLVRDVSVQGKIVAAVSPTLYATASGSITLQAVAGEQVVAGQILASVDSPELTSLLRQSESALEQRKVELQRQHIQSPCRCCTGRSKP